MKETDFFERSEADVKGDMNITNEFYTYLQGKKNTFGELEKLDKPFSTDDAYKVINLFRYTKGFDFIPEWVEQCDICKKLYDINKNEGDATDHIFDGVIPQLKNIFTEKQRDYIYEFADSKFDGNINFCNECGRAWEKLTFIILEKTTQKLYPDLSRSVNWKQIMNTYQSSK